MRGALRTIAILVLALGVSFLLLFYYDQVRLAQYAIARGLGQPLKAEGLAMPLLIAAILAGGMYAFFKRSYGAAILFGTIGTFFAFGIWAIVAAGAGM